MLRSTKVSSTPASGAARARYSPAAVPTHTSPDGSSASVMTSAARRSGPARYVVKRGRRRGSKCTSPPVVATQYVPSRASTRSFTVALGKPCSVPNLTKSRPSNRAKPSRVQNQRNPRESLTMRLTT